jgi:hypothetical protein
MKGPLSNIENRIKDLFGISTMNYNQYYYKVGGQINDLNYYLTLFKKCSCNDFISTNHEICKSKSLKFGCSIDDVKKKLCNVNLHYFDNQPLKIVILYYKTLIGHYKVRTQLHFHNKKLFLFNYSFPYTNKTEKDEIISIIRQKYIADKEESNLRIIADSFNNCIQIDDNVEFTINYLSMNCELFNPLSLLSNISDEEEEKKKHKLQYNKLFNIL